VILHLDRRKKGIHVDMQNGFLYGSCHRNKLYPDFLLFPISGTG
jgi:hypothetical protein